MKQAIEFIKQCYSELGKSPEEMEKRIEVVLSSIESTGSYIHTKEELSYGAKMAWRNNSRCIGRLFWESLELFDEREAESEEQIAGALFRHIAYATNEGRIRPAITVFAQEREERRVRIWNHQLIRYAGYESSDGVAVLGDPASVEFTKQCMQLGWRGAGSAYDILPLVVQIDEREPRWFSLPSELVMEVGLLHPELERFAELGLKWYAVPIISDMKLEIGGISYTAAPFNGWYMETEIGARNLADAERYNMLPRVAELLGLDTSTNTSLWKDRALVELNRAVIHSFKAAGVSIVDHHTAAEQFALFERREAGEGREVNANWAWLIPPLSPATTRIWHQHYTEAKVSPDYLYQRCPFH